MNSCQMGAMTAISLLNELALDLASTPVGGIVLTGAAVVGGLGLSIVWMGVFEVNWGVTATTVEVANPLVEVGSRVIKGVVVILCVLEIVDRLEPAPECCSVERDSTSDGTASSELLCD